MSHRIYNNPKINNMSGLENDTDAARVSGKGKKRIFWLFRLFFKPPVKRRVLLEAFMLSFMIRLVVLFLPFKVLTWLMRAKQCTPSTERAGSKELENQENQYREHNKEEGSDAEKLPRISESTKQKLREIIRSVDAVSRRVPWKATCLVQAVSGKIMLNRRNLSGSLYLGVEKKRDGSMSPHAWLTSQNRVIIGGTGLDKYVIVSSFS